MSWLDNTVNWLGDAVGWGEGEWYEGWGVGDESGAYQGFLGTGGEGTGPMGTPSERAVDAKTGEYEEYMETAREDSEEAMQPIKDKIAAMEKAAGDIPTFEEWMQDQGYALNDVQGSDAMAGLEALTEQLAAGPSDEDYDAAYANAARLMGLSPEEAQMLLGNLTKQMAGFEEGMTEEELREAGVLDRFAGMSAEEETLRRRQNQSNIRQMEQRAQRLVQDSLADTGSTARMLQTADEATMQINNAQIQQDAMLAQEQFERQFAQFESQKQTWQQMVQTNQMGTQQYIQNMQQSMGMAMQGYAQQINALFQENQQYLQQYEADRNTLVAQVDAMYKAATLELGVAQAEIDMMESLYNAQVLPELTALQNQLAAEEMETDWWGVLLGGVQIAAGVGALFVPGGQAIGVGLIGSGAGTAAGAL